jgi:hypothetical protein
MNLDIGGLVIVLLVVGVFGHQIFLVMRAILEDKK